MKPPRRIVNGYRCQPRQVTTIAEVLDKLPSQYWGTTRPTIAKTIHARLKELCQKWDGCSIDTREAGIVFQSDGELDIEGMLTFEILIDCTMGRMAPQLIAYRLHPKPAGTAVRRAGVALGLRLLKGGRE